MRYGEDAAKQQVATARDSITPRQHRVNANFAGSGGLCHRAALLEEAAVLERPASDGAPPVGQASRAEDYRERGKWQRECRARSD